MPSPSNDFSSVKLCGERLAVVELDDGDLIMGDMTVPDTAMKIHRFVRVVAKGDGRWKASNIPVKTLPDVNVGDIVMVQINPQMVNIYNHGDKTAIVMHWGDALAKVTDPTQLLSTKNVVPVGKWVFADVSIASTQGILFLPDDSSAGETTTRLVSSGSLAELEHIEPETRLWLDVSKVSHFSLGDSDELIIKEKSSLGYQRRRKLVYVSCDYVLGTVDETRFLTLRHSVG